MARGRGGEAEDVLTLIIEIVQNFHRLRALGRASGVVSEWGGGTWGFLRTLALAGPQTVPDIARARPVARQRIQRLADEAAASGLVEFIDNPRHRRSKLVQLTAKGEAEYARMSAVILARCARLAKNLDAAEVKRAAATLSRLREGLGT
jgi:DNA-binding MarR family transcriptional regulator